MLDQWDPRQAAVVSLGAVVGAVIRWAAIRLFGDSAIDEVLLAVNVAGCLLLGLVSQLPPRLGPVRHLLGAGLAGTLTTWSSLALQSATDIRAGAWLAAAAWLAANLLIGVGAALAGRSLGVQRWGSTQ